MRPLIFATLCLSLFIATGCQEETQTVKIPSQSAQHDNGQPNAPAPVTDQETTVEKQLVQTKATEQQTQPEREPPKPPAFEDFQGEPQLTLFPRAGDFRPANNSDRLPYWNTFIEQLIKVTGVAEDQTTGSRGWVFRSIKSIDSVGFFSPLAVEPQTTYKVSFKLAAELTKDTSAGIDILEFNQFLWIPTQYTEETFKQHFRGSHEGKRLTGTTQGGHTFTFTSGPDTQMIHMLLFREGEHDQNSVMFDDIGIEEVKGKSE